jgi:NAD(P)-dependent dehydrogenase (short-subunit alcohol dehydrogenase family)
VIAGVLSKVCCDLFVVCLLFQILSFVECSLQYGRLDVLVNNAAGNFLCLAEDLSLNAFKSVIDIDLVILMMLCVW